MSFLSNIFPRRTSPKNAATEQRAAAPRIIPRSEHPISRRDISPNALKVLYRLDKAGYKAYLVGGAVRDLLLGVEPKDFDVATDAHPEEIRELFRNSRLIGRRFRLAHVRFGREVIEVATFRAAHNSDSNDAAIASTGRILRDNVYGEINDDVWRRDFTVNALYYDIRDFSIVDYVGGVEDIEARRLRLIGDVAERIREDPVRVLRAVRFASKLQLSIDHTTRAEFKRLGELLTAIAPARLFDESLKLFHSGHGEQAFAALQAEDLFACLFPHAAGVLANNRRAHDFVVAALRNTDARIERGQSVHPAFVFAAILWGSVDVEYQRQMAAGIDEHPAFKEGADVAIQQQIARTAIPRRLSAVMRDIWFLQMKLTRRTVKRALSALEHPRFRAAYDFLLLRAEVDDNLADVATWWTQLQDADKDTRAAMIEGLRQSKRRRRAPKMRKHRP